MMEQPAGHGLRWWHWWPMLLAPLDMAVVYLIRDTPFGLSLRFLDASVVPMVIAGLAMVAAAAVAWWRRNPLMWLMAALGFFFFLREAHVPGGDATSHLPFIKKGVYAGAVLVGVWAYFWRERLRGPLSDGVVLGWLVATGWTYIASQMIARGAFKFISDVYASNGERLRTPMEETCETLAHTMLLALAVIVWWRGKRKVKSEE